MRLASGDCGGRGGTSRDAGTGGAPVRMGSAVSKPEVSEERLARIDDSSSDSEPGPGDIGAAAGGCGGTGRDSVGGGRGTGRVLVLGGCGGRERS